MALHADWLEWIFEQRTDVWIAERSGIPRSTIGFVRRGERELGSQYWGSLRSAYQSETTKRLGDIGLPHRQAIRFSMSAPDRQREIESEMQSVTMELTSGATSAAFHRSGMDTEDFPWESTYASYDESIKAAIRRADRTWEDIKEGRVS